jgi:hypothetical protein
MHSSISSWKRWRRGRVDDLDYFLPTHDDRSVAFLVHLQKWAIARGLKSFEADYVSAARSRRPLRFSSLDEPQLERAWRTHWISPDLPDKQAERVIERQSAPPDLVVIQPVKDFTCAECGGSSGDLLTMDDAGPLCMSCADMDHLVFLPPGDAALTRRAKKASRLSAVVVRWSRSRKRYERQGLLVEDDELLMSGTARADARTSPLSTGCWPPGQRTMSSARAQNATGRTTRPISGERARRRRGPAGAAARKS